MNKKTVIILVILVIVVIGVILGSKSKKSKQKPVMETPIEVLDRQTKADSTNTINSNLNAINVDAESNADFKSMDANIETL